MSKTKACSYCKEELPVTEEFYYITKRGYPTGKCRICRQIDFYKRYHRNPQEWRDYNARSRSRAGSYKRFLWDIKKRYGLDEQSFRDLMDKQEGCCSICGSSLVNPVYHFRDLVVDHCHTTGKVRGLLCSNCNSALGLLKDDLESADKLVRYLEDHLESEV